MNPDQINPQWVWDDISHTISGLAVPIDKLTGIYREIQSFGDLNRETLEQISHLFEHYKDLERGKWVQICGWADIDKAKAEILASVERFKDYRKGLQMIRVQRLRFAQVL